MKRDLAYYKGQEQDQDYEMIATAITGEYYGPIIRKQIRTQEIIRRLERWVGVGLMLIIMTGCEYEEANVSAYCPAECCCGIWATEGVNSKGERVTSSQHVIRPGDKFCAAPPEYPFGTMITVPGYGRVPVLDRGGAIKGNKFDLYFDTHQEALQWGRQNLSVRIERKKQ